jgi:hypothetical protein
VIPPTVRAFNRRGYICTGGAELLRLTYKDNILSCHSTTALTVVIPLSTFSTKVLTRCFNVDNRLLVKVQLPAGITQLQECQAIGTNVRLVYVRGSIGNFNKTLCRFTVETFHNLIRFLIN